MCCYHPPTKLWEGNVFSRICLFTGCPMWPLAMMHWTSPYSPHSNVDMSKVVQLGPHCTGTPLFQPCPPFGLQAGGSHPTGMLSCDKIQSLLSNYRLQVSGLLWDRHMEHQYRIVSVLPAVRTIRPTAPDGGKMDHLPYGLFIFTDPDSNSDTDSDPIPVLSSWDRSRTPCSVKSSAWYDADLVCRSNRNWNRYPNMAL